MSETAYLDSAYYGIEVQLVGRVLECRLVDSARADAEVVWSLHRGDFDPRRASEPVSGGPVWVVTLPDRTYGYAVRARVDGVTYESRWVQYFDTGVKERYEKWRAEWSGNSHDIPDELPLFRYEQPFENIAFIYGAPPYSDGLETLAKALGLHLESGEGELWSSLKVLSGGASDVDSCGVHYKFSGITRDSKRLLFGKEDVRAFISEVRVLSGGIGEFQLLSWDANSLTFEADYIGQGHIFYYATDEVLVAANGVHFLALVLRALGVNLRIDSVQSRVKFFSTSYPFEFQHGPRTDFEGVSRLSVYDRIVVDAEGIRFEKRELWHDSQDGELSDELYEDLLVEAAAEITDNVRIALDCPRFDNVVVELSAGLDSRIIYSALTNLAHSGKVRISTRPGPEQRIAAAVNNLYQIPWDDLPKRYSFDGNSAGRLPASSHSVFMDGYYIESMFKPRAHYVSPTLVLTGHGGEAFSRVMSVEGYFARDFDGRLPAAPECFEDVYKNVVRYIGNHQVWLEAGEMYFGEILRRSLAESPAARFSKRFDDLYVSERNPYVCGSVYRGAMSSPQWRPLHSRALFRLKSLWFQRRQDYRLQFDLIRLLNPLISEVPYLKPIEVARKRQYETLRAPFPIGAPIEFDQTIIPVSSARREADRRAVYLPTKAKFQEVEVAVREYEESVDGFLEPLGHILDLAPELHDLGLPLFAYIERMNNRTNPRSFSKRHNIRNKLHILLQEIMLCR